MSFNFRTLQLSPVFYNDRGEFRRAYMIDFQDRILKLVDDFISFCRKRSDEELNLIGREEIDLSLEVLLDAWITNLKRTDFQHDVYEVGWHYDFGPMVLFVFMLAAHRLTANPALLDFEGHPWNENLPKKPRPVPKLLENGSDRAPFELILDDSEDWPKKHIVTPRFSYEHTLYDDPEKPLTRPM
ncbi:hypothetical protein [Mycolicibacterium grossiae]|nr:hypothetical protein [Mycolicibacterium grossiae]QEM43531.1 hypothetical protein FZ046_00945 [Mycolicibacterium grossiae]